MVIAALVAFVLTAVRPAVAPGATLRAQAANDSTPVQKRTAQIVEMLNGAPLDLDTMFTSTFLSQVPAARLQAAVAQMTAQTGSVVSIATLAAPVVGDANSARFRFTTSKNFAIPV
ncbi:MAG TPA: Cpe/LpqF family protein, partial [Gemmatimonadaceae bacterium]